ncbi:NAD(P)H-hydrate epimerase, partial [Desulfovibrio sp. OttesenSCG-928-C06]|nr:NAD(P)H-hydrate epimerase [Desulfovibrio sp. OttesenSCG-928-C06]
MRNNLLFSPLASPQDIAVWDAKSAEAYGVPTFLLMENAAREAMHVLKRYCQPGPELSVAVIAGGGNNGGDGISLARHLHNLGCRVLLLTLPSPGSYRGICRKHLRMAVLAGVRVQRLSMKNGLPCLPRKWEFGKAPASVSADAIECSRSTAGTGKDMKDASSRAGLQDTLLGTQPGVLPDVIIDAVLGAGFKAPLRPGVATLIRQINTLREQGTFVFSLDIPSGLGAISGRPEPEAVRA